MKTCPVCHSGALTFDEYFERYRCSNPQCGYMPPSSAERALNRIKNPGIIKIIDEHVEIPEIGFSMSIYHDTYLDSLIFDFDQMEPSIELPEEDGRMIWKISKATKKVTGFELLFVKSLNIHGVVLGIVSTKKQLIENAIKNMSFRNRMPIQYLIKQVTVYCVLNQNRIQENEISRDLANRIDKIENEISDSIK